MKKVLIMMAVAGLPLLYACKEEKKEKRSNSYPVLTVDTRNQTLYTRYAATLKGKQFVEVRPQVSGTITEICFNEGDWLQKGQTLFVIDQVPYQAALETAAANTRSAEAKLKTAQLTADSKEELCKAHIVSDFDNQTAQNTLQEAKANLLQAQAQETNARNNLSYTVIKSPVNGVASMIPYRVGALVSSNQTEPLVTVSDDEEVYAYFSMDENQVLNLTMQYGSLKEAIAQMPPVELELSNGKKYAHPGKIDAISGTVDAGTGAVSVRACFPNPEQLLRNGASGKVIVPSELKDCIVIPQTATYELQNRVFVFRVSEGKAQSAPVEVYRLNNGTDYVVESGLQAGDVIIAEGAGLVKEGTPVTAASTTNPEKEKAL